MTEQLPTPSGTPLWQPQPYAPQHSPWPPVPTQDPRLQAQPHASAPQPYPPQPYPQAQPPYSPPQPFPNQALPGAYWPSNPGIVPPPTPAKRWQSPLPVAPMRHHQFLHTPRRRWWKLPIALLVAGLAWLIGTVIATLPAIAYDLIDQKIPLTDPVALQEFLTTIMTNVTPAIFLANNVGIALMIPAAWLGLIIYGQRPRWLSSVTGRLRWGWMFKLMALIAIPYLAMQAFDAVTGGYAGISWRPYSLFMIFVVLLTTPLQCAGEEYGIRGLINRLLGSYGSARISFWIGAIGSSVVFMFLHAARDPYLNAFYFTFGMIACWMAWRTGGLEASIAMHVVNNVLAMSVLPFSDFSGMFERGVGSANALDLAPLVIVLLACVGIVEWQVRRNKPVAIAAPGAADGPPAAFRFTALEGAR
ncbi:MAG: CPBP family intramembrane glutamic endopeptidase [Propionibacteriaceae bacterium]